MTALPEDQQSPPSADVNAQAERLLLKQFAPDYAVTDRAGRVIEASPGLKKFAADADTDTIFNVLTDADETLRPALQQAIEVSASTQAAVTRECRAVPVDGQSRHILVTVQPLVDGDQEESLLLVVLEDKGPATPVAEDRDADLLLHKVIDHMLNFVGMLDLNGILLEANETALAAGGVTREDVIGKPFWDCYWWSHDTEVMARLQNAVREARSGRTVRYDEVVQLAGGQLFTIDFMLVPVTDELGQVTHLIPSGVDITDRKEIEDSLRKTNELVQTMSENSTHGLVMMDARGHVISCNQAWRDMCGYSDEEMHAAPLHDLVHHHHPDGRPYPMSECPIDRALPEDNSLRAHEDLFFRKDGSTFPVQCAASPIFRNGVPVSTVIEVQDITGRKAAEAELLAREAHLRRVINNQLGLVGLIDSAGNLLEVDDRSLAIAGATRSEVIGRNFAECPWWTYDDSVTEKMRQTMELAFAGETVRFDVQLYGGGLNGADDRLWIDFMMAPVHGTHGEVEYLIPSGVDITERKAAEIALRQSEERLKLGIEVAEFGLAQINYRTDTVSLSAEAAMLYGLGREAMKVTRDRLHATFHPDDADGLHSSIEDCLNAGQDCSMAVEHRVMLPDGSIRWVDIRKKIFFDEDARVSGPVYASLAARDITERKQTEIELAENSLRFTMALRAGGMAAWEWTPTGSIWTPELYEILGLPTELPATPDTLFRTVHPEDVAGLQTAWEEATAGKSPYDHLFRVVRPDGEIAWVRGVGEVIRDEAGEVVKMYGLNWDETQEYLINKELAEANAKFRTLFDQAFFYTGILSCDGTLTDINEAALKPFGFERDEVLGLPFWETPLWRDQPQSQQKLKEAFQRAVAGESYREELSFFAPDGSLSWSDFVYQPALDDAGRVMFVVANGSDITERYKSRAELADSRRRLALAMSSARMGSFIWDRETDRTEWDLQWYEALGVPEDVEASGETFFNLVHPEDQDRLIQEINRSQAEGSDYRHEFRIIRPDGQVRWIAAIGNWMKERKGPAKRLSGLNWDITEQKEYETNIKLSEERLRIAAEAAGFGTFHVDVQKGDASWSAEMRRIIGLGPDDPCVTAVSEVPEFVHPEDRGLVQAYMRRVLKASDQSDHVLDHRIIRPDGEIRHVRMQSRSLFEGEGSDRRLSVIIGTLLDITQQREYEQSLDRARRAAQAASESKSEFVANMSHEIRTPMTAVLGYADLLFDREHDSVKLDYLRTIKRNGNFLLDIINDILDLSKIEAGKMEVARDWFSPLQVIADVRSMMQIRASEKGLDFQVLYEGSIPEQIESDPKRLKQVLVNLVGNAVKFTEEGRVTLTVRYKTAPRPSLQFEVSDTGIGISREQQQKLFQPFTQADTSVNREFGGTGLGLAISHRLTTMLGGTISVVSEPGRGSTFSFSVTTGEVQEGRFVAPRSDSPSDVQTDADAEVRLDCHLLIVDDRRDIRFLAGHLLSRAGATVEQAEHGEAAVEHMEDALAGDRRVPDLILLDMQMPRLDGYQTAVRLREMNYTGPIVALTADAMHGDMDRCLRSGCDAYLSKPINASKLLNLVHQFVTEAEERRS